MWEYDLYMAREEEYNLTLTRKQVSKKQHEALPLTQVFILDES